MTTISDTIRTALDERGNGRYIDYAGPAIEALTDREREISQQLLSYASDLGANTDEVRDKLMQLGMEVSQAPTAVDDDEPDTTVDSEAIARIEMLLNGMAERVNSLTRFARRNGYTG